LRDIVGREVESVRLGGDEDTDDAERARMVI